MTEDDLTQAFAAMGSVESATIISDRQTGRAKGFGFVEMPNKAEADKAIRELNGKEFEGRAIVVNEARPRAERGDSRRF
jgi:RNA recognition motif-containing protein